MNAPGHQLGFDVVTLFPSMFAGPLQDGVLARARRSGRVSVRLHDLRRWGIGSHRLVDDSPYGGGGGMVLRPEPLFEAVDRLREHGPRGRTVLLAPQGRRFDHDVARELSGEERLILLCGRYEGIDDRVREGLADDVISVGDFVLTGGELPAMLLIDAVSRFVEGVLGQEKAAEADSFAQRRLEHPYYTRPSEFRGMRVPEVLLSGDHAAVRAWREATALAWTEQQRPDLLDR